MTKPYWLGLERQAFVASHQYVEARRTELNDLLIKVEEIDVSLVNPSVSEGTKRGLRTQRTGLVQRMKTAASEIPDDAVPSRVTRFLALN